VRIRSNGILSLAATLPLVFFIAPMFSLLQLEYPTRPFGSGIPCGQTTYIIERHASPSTALLGFGGVRFEISNYSMTCDNGRIGCFPYPHSFHILTWDSSNVSQYLSSLAACPLCP
jgi:hypothetical protein